MKVTGILALLSTFYVFPGSKDYCFRNKRDNLRSRNVILVHGIEAVGYKTGIEIVYIYIINFWFESNTTL